MAKKQIRKKPLQMEDLGKAHIRENLKRIHPFLRKKFRTVQKDETHSLEVLRELFPEYKDTPDEQCIKGLFKLHAVYVLQN